MTDWIARNSLLDEISEKNTDLNQEKRYIEWLSFRLIEDISVLVLHIITISRVIYSMIDFISHKETIIPQVNLIDHVTGVRTC